VDGSLLAICCGLLENNLLTPLDFFPTSFKLAIHVFSTRVWTLNQDYPSSFFQPAINVAARTAAGSPGISLHFLLSAGLLLSLLLPPLL
jgi:hypothetical protein